MSLEPKRTVAELKELRSLTADEHGAQRVAWTDTWLCAREWFAKKLAELPVEHHYDTAGNNWATLRGASEECVLIGGHLDSVPNGGWLDGSLNVLAALEVLRHFASDFNGHPPVTIRLVDWADEEGARFGRSLLGSSAFAGTHSISADRIRTDREGTKLEVALRRCGVEIDRFPEAERERQIAHFVDHQNFRRQVHAHPAIQPSFPIRAPQVRCQIVRGDEIRPQPRADGLFRQRHWWNFGLRTQCFKRTDYSSSCADLHFLHHFPHPHVLTGILPSANLL